MILSAFVLASSVIYTTECQKWRYFVEVLTELNVKKEQVYTPRNEKYYWIFDKIFDKYGNIQPGREFVVYAECLKNAAI